MSGSGYRTNYNKTGSFYTHKSPFRTLGEPRGVALERCINPAVKISDMAAKLFNTRLAARKINAVNKFVVKPQSGDVFDHYYMTKT